MSSVGLTSYSSQCSQGPSGFNVCITEKTRTIEAEGLSSQQLQDLCSSLFSNGATPSYRGVKSEWGNGAVNVSLSNDAATTAGGSNLILPKLSSITSGNSQTSFPVPSVDWQA